MTFKTLSLRSLSTLALVVGLAFAGSAAAESACKGMSQSKCKANEACSWVGGYITGKGVKVASYCRNKSSKSKSSSSSKKSDSAKTSDSKKKSESKEKTSKSSS